ncbi:MAG: hypothetical protein CL792_03375 [Chloroflexi bacterium]|nr:hypothetical protein [Chloroflexota bacterium]|tara:strand:+ start:1032 stop:1250 length:219 start_codon:yes stop_codon:yes gene_type:complete
MWRASVINLVGVGVYLATSILVPTLIGHYFDGRLSTEPLFSICGLILGLFVGFIGAYRQLQDVIRDTDSERG